MKKALSLLFLLLLISFNSLLSQPKLVFVIRVDDILSRNTSMLPRSIMDFGDAVKDHGGKVTWAVIPHRLIESQSSDGLTARELKLSVNDGHEAALHGYNHICPLCGSSGHEMFCPSKNMKVPFDQQKKFIEEGLKILKDSTGIVPVGFVPPGHYTDSATFDILNNMGFSWISTTGKSKLFIRDHLYNLSPGKEFTWSLTQSDYKNQLTQALRDIRNNGETAGYYCLLLHDPFIRKGYENGLVVKWTSELLDSLNSYYGNRILYKTLSEAVFYYSGQATYAERNILDNSRSFNLAQNYPNPFNPVTKIEYNINCHGSAVLKVYDMLGREVRCLVNEYKAPGSYTVWFDGAGLSAGTYLYMLSTKNGSISRKMSIIK